MALMGAAPALAALANADMDIWRGNTTFFLMGYYRIWYLSAGEGKGIWVLALLVFECRGVRTWVQGGRHSSAGTGGIECRGSRTWVQGVSHLSAGGLSLECRVSRIRFVPVFLVQGVPRLSAGGLHLSAGGLALECWHWGYLSAGGLALECRWSGIGVLAMSHFCAGTWVFECMRSGTGCV